MSSQTRGAVNPSSGFMSVENVRKAREALDAKGCLLIPGALGPEVCDDVIRWIDASVREGDERNYAGTEHRIWNAENRSPILARFKRESDIFMSCLVGADKEAYTLLAIRNRPLDAKDDNSRLGRWHIDSFRRQLKIFLFLSEVRETSGCFEHIPGTHRSGFKVRAAISGAYFKAVDALKGTRAYSRLDDAWIERIHSAGYQSVPVVCPAGTLMVVDTSSIHRARPCIEGSRYALTAYYR